MASGNIKDIKRRIKSVQSTKQITKAMELVASSKLRHARDRVDQARPYFNTLYNSLLNISADRNCMSSVFMKARPVKKSVFIVIAGDRGLAGGYNSNVLKLAMSKIKERESVEIVTIGKKSQEFFSKHPYPIRASYPGIGETLRITHTHEMLASIIQDYRDGKIDELCLFFTQYVSNLQQQETAMKLLPADFKNSDEMEKRKVKEGKISLTHYDPSPEVVFDAIIPEYLRGVLYSAVVESYASEQCARRSAMESASDNASEMIEHLNLSYNRARQAAITQEITEIVAGSGQVG
jgi:F-type H+-transporting ATPase subunit gamma